MPDTDKASPRPCPFCGGPAEYMERGEFPLHSGQFFGVCCKNHCAVAPHTGWHRDRGVTLLAWNQRPAFDALVAALKRAGEFVANIIAESPKIGTTEAEDWWLARLGKDIDAALKLAEAP